MIICIVIRSLSSQQRNCSPDPLGVSKEPLVKKVECLPGVVTLSGESKGAVSEGFTLINLNDLTAPSMRRICNA